MSIYIGLYEFHGPFADATDLENGAGLYAILHNQDEDYQLVDLGEADSIRDHLDTLNAVLMTERYPGEVSVAAFYTPGLAAYDRQNLATAILKEFDGTEQAAGAAMLAETA